MWPVGRRAIDHLALGPLATDEPATVECADTFAGIAPASWQRALEQGDSNVVFLTREWQHTWWELYGRGQLLLTVVRRCQDIVALAPLFADEDGMVYFVGSGGCGSDYLDFIGDISDPWVLDTLLATARQRVAHFAGFRFYHVPERSRTGARLREAAERLGLDFRDEGHLPAPVLNLEVAGAAEAAVNKKSLRRHERYFDRTGTVTVRELRRRDEILPHLEEFFEQHVARWQATPFPSLFLTPRHREFYRRLVDAAADRAWLRFTRIEWQDRAIAMHVGFCYNRSFLWYKPTFAIDLARHSPGEVLLRRLLLSAMDEQAATFDFGIGDEPFKQRFATATPLVQTWGLYAPGQAPVF
jgi:CelD/BcsL family acetyltransferase involved in cellulose biosynthesis